MEEPWPEIAAAVLVLTLVVWGFSRLLHFVRVAQRRRGIQNFLLGVEAALQEQPESAEKRLRSVLEMDPENLGARMLLARVQLERGEAGAAHQQHLLLRRSFGMSTSESEAGLAASLLALDRAPEAEGVMGKAAGKDAAAEVLAVHFQTLAAAGRHEESVAVARRWVARSADPAMRQRAQHELAGASARSGLEAVRRNDASSARMHLALAKQASGQHPQVSELTGRLAISEAVKPGGSLDPKSLGDALARLDAAQLDAPLGSESVAALLPLSDGRMPANPLVAMHLPAAAPESGLSDAAAKGAESGPGPSHPAVSLLHRMVPAYAYRCGRCGAPAMGTAAPCSACGAVGRAQPVEPLLGEEVQEPAALMDAVEANLQHLKRQAARALEEGDGEALVELEESGARGIAAVLGLAMQGKGLEPAALRLFQQMGPRITGDLLVAYQECLSTTKTGWLALFGGATGGAERAANLVGRVLMGFGSAAQQFVEPLLSTADRDQRKLLIDYHIGLADPGRFGALLNRFPLLEVLQRINQADEAPLQRFFAALEGEDPVLTVLLREPVFAREVDLLRALPQAKDPEALLKALCTRQPGHGLIQAAIEGLVDGAQRAASRRVLTALGGGTVDHLVACYADLDRSQAVRTAVGEVLVELGPLAVGELCDAYGPELAPEDDHIDRLLISMGAEAVPALTTAYRQKGLRERIAGAWLSRFTHRRDRIVMALAHIGGGDARKALSDLRTEETDRSLKLRLDHALQKVGTRSARNPSPQREGRHGGSAG